MAMLRPSFNSFGDSTVIEVVDGEGGRFVFQFLRGFYRGIARRRCCCVLPLSIPSGILLGRAASQKGLVGSDFQFLRGFYIQYIYTHISHPRRTFNSFGDSTFLKASTHRSEPPLSIPSGILLSVSKLVERWLRAFNSFGDSTEEGAGGASSRAAAFQFLRGFYERRRSTEQ